MTNAVQDIAGKVGLNMVCLTFHASYVTFVYQDLSERGYGWKDRRRS